MAIETLLELIERFRTRASEGEEHPGIQGLENAIARHDARGEYPVETPEKRAARAQAQQEIMQKERRQLPQGPARRAVDREIGRAQRTEQQSAERAAGPVPSVITSDLEPHEEAEAAFKRGFNRARPINARRPY